MTQRLARRSICKDQVNRSDRDVRVRRRQKVRRRIETSLLGCMDKIDDASIRRVHEQDALHDTDVGVRGAEICQ